MKSDGHLGLVSGVLEELAFSQQKTAVEVAASQDLRELLERRLNGPRISAKEMTSSIAAMIARKRRTRLSARQHR